MKLGKCGLSCSLITEMAIKWLMGGEHAVWIHTGHHEISSYHSEWCVMQNL